MPHILVMADQGNGAVMFRERVNLADFESQHFATQLIERLGWAVEDAHEAERTGPAARTAETPQPPARVVTTAS